MAQVIRRSENKRQPGFFERLARGVGEGTEQATSDIASLHAGREKEKQRNLAGASRELKHRLSLHPRGSFSSEDIGSIENKMISLINQGLSKEEAARMVFQESMNPSSSNGSPKTRPSSFSEGIKENFGVGPMKFGELAENVKDVAAKATRPLVGLADLPFEVIQGARDAEKMAFAKAMGISSEKVEELEKQRQQTLGPLSVFPVPQGVPNLTEKFDTATGGRGLPQNAAERVLQGYPLGPAGLAGGALREAVPENAPDWVKGVADIAGFIAFLKASPHLGRLSSFLEETSRSVGTSPEDLIKKAQAESGADLQKIASGNAAESNKLIRQVSKEVPEVGKRVAETPKKVFNAEQAMRQRESFGAKLPESPLEEYFKPEREVAPKPETLSKKAEVEARLKPLEEQKWAEYNRLRDEVRSLQAARRGAPPESFDRLQSNIRHLEETRLPKVLEELKDLQYEMKYSRPRPTEAEIDAAIKRSADEFIAEAKNPTEQGQKEIHRQLDLDKKYIEQAQKLIARGELPGELRPDTFLKMKKKYLDGYNSIIRELRDEVRALMGSRDAADLKKISDNKKAVGHLENRIKRLESDLVNQTDKIKATRALEKPSGAFYKQQLKSLRNDIADFQKDYFRHAKRIKSPSEMKVERVGKETFEQGRKLGEEVAKNPTPENLEKIGAKPSETAEAFKEIKDFGKKVENGTLKEKDIPKVSNALSKWLKRLKLRPRNMAWGAGLGLIKYAIEESLDVEINDGIFTALALRSPGTAGVGFASSAIYKYLSGLSAKREVERVRSLPLGERIKEIENWKNRFPPKKVKRLHKTLKEGQP